MNDSMPSVDINDFISCDHQSARSLNKEFMPTSLGALLSLIDE